MSDLKYFCINILLLIIVISCNARSYVDSSLGLKLEIPGDVIIFKNQKLNDKEWEKLQKSWNNKYVLSINDIGIKDFGPFTRQPDVTEQQIVEGIMNMFNNGKHQMFFSGTINRLIDKSFQYYKNGKIIGEKYFYMNTAPIHCNSDFIVNAEQAYLIELSLIKNNRVVTINLTYNDSDMTIAKESPEYFKKDNNNWVYKEQNVPDQMYDLIIQKSDKAPKELVKLFEYFDEIEKSIVLK